MVFGVITEVLVVLTFGIFGQNTNLLAKTLSDESLWWVAAIGLAVVAVV